MFKKTIDTLIKSENSAVSAVWYLAGTVLIQGINFIMVPVFTNLMSVSNYGMLSLCTMWVSIFSTFITLQVHGSINNALIEFGEANINKYVSSIQCIELISFLVIFTFGYIYKTWFATLLQIPVNIFIVLLITSFFQSCIQLQLAEYVALKKHKKYFILSFAFTVISIVLSVILVIYQADNTKYYGKIFGTLIANLIIGLIILVSIFMKGKTLLKKDYIVFCFSLTLPLILHGLAQIVLGQSDRYMLKLLADDGAYSVGIYSYAYTIGSVINVLWLAFNYAWVPWYYDKSKCKDIKKIKYVMNYYLILFSTLTISFLMVSPEIVKLMTPTSYWEGIYIIPLIILGYYFMFLYSFPVNYEFYHKKTVWISIGTVLAAMINILFNYLLIPKYNEYGASVATLLSFLILFLFHYLIARFIIKDYETGFSLFLINLIIICLAVILFYFIIKLFILRWIISILVLIFGSYIVFNKYRKSPIKKRHSK